MPSSVGTWLASSADTEPASDSSSAPSRTENWRGAGSPGRRSRSSPAQGPIGQAVDQLINVISQSISRLTNQPSQLRAAAGQEGVGGGHWGGRQRGSGPTGRRL